VVSAQYPTLLRTPSNAAEHTLLDAVAPGEHLRVVHHLLDDRVSGQQARAGGFDPADHVRPADVAQLLDDSWTVEFEAYRPRRAVAGGHHTHDVVLRHCRSASSGERVSRQVATLRS
jgi:hypothetical protein